MAFIAGWFLLSLAVGMAADSRFNRFGFGWFVLSLVTSPLIGGAFLFAAGPKVKRVRASKMTRAWASRPPTPPPLPINDLDAAIRSLRSAA